MHIIRKLAATLIGVLVLTLAGTLAAQAADTHKVRSGDTLSEIAADYGTSWPTLYKWNRDKIDNPDLIFPGQRLVVSGGKSKAAKSESKPKKESGSSGSGGKVRPATGPVTSEYGMRTHPITGVYKLHTGIDFGYGDGIARAAASGTVDSVTHPGWAGNLVEIDHPKGVETRYAHLASVSVSPGQKVKAGQKVGTIGARGMATGPHLHFEVLINGDYVNPRGWLN